MRPTPSQSEFETQRERHDERRRQCSLSLIIGTATIIVVICAVIAAVFFSNIIGFIGTGLLVWPMVGIGLATYTFTCRMLNHGPGVFALTVVSILSFSISYVFLVPYWQQMFGMGPLWRYW